MPKNGLALVRKVVCEFMSQRILRLNVDEGMLIGQLVPCGALPNGMVCGYTTGRYANETSTNLEQNEHARARRKAKKSEGSQENSKTNEYKEM